MVSIEETDAKLNKSLGAYGIEWHDSLQMKENVKGRMVMLDGNQSVIRLPSKPKTPEDYGYLAHEIFHAVEFLFERIRLPHSIDSGEAYAYLIGYITTEIYKKIK